MSNKKQNDPKDPFLVEFFVNCGISRMQARFLADQAGQLKGIAFTRWGVSIVKAPWMKTLGVGRFCKRAEVKKAAHKLQMQYHPDRQMGASPEEQEAATAKFREIQAAWEEATKVFDLRDQIAEAKEKKRKKRAKKRAKAKAARERQAAARKAAKSM